MLKLEIKMDEEKIRAEKKYSVESIYQALQQAFSKYKFNQMQDADGTMSFTGNGNPKDYGAFGNIITSLREKTWMNSIQDIISTIKQPIWRFLI